MAKDKSIPSNIILAKEKFKYDTIQDMVNDITLKVGMVVDINGYYKPDDGATHKRVIADTDDGSGVQLTNGLWANRIIDGKFKVFIEKDLEFAFSKKISSIILMNDLVLTKKKIFDNFETIIDFNFKNITLTENYSDTECFEINKSQTTATKNLKAFTFKNLKLDLSGTNNTVNVFKVGWLFKVSFEHLNIKELKGTLFDYFFDERCGAEVKLYDITMTSADIVGNVGLKVQWSDSSVINFFPVGFSTGIIATSSANQFINCHPWGYPTSSSNGLKNFICIEDRSDNTWTNCIADTPEVKDISLPPSYENGGIGFCKLGAYGRFLGCTVIVHGSTKDNSNIGFYSLNTFNLSLINCYIRGKTEAVFKDFHFVNKDGKLPYFNLVGCNFSYLKNNLEITNNSSYNTYFDRVPVFNSTYGFTPVLREGSFYISAFSNKRIFANIALEAVNQERVYFKVPRFMGDTLTPTTIENTKKLLTELNDEIGSHMLYFSFIENNGNFYPIFWDKNIKNFRKADGSVMGVVNASQLNTLYYGEKMKQEGVYNDFITYMDEKTVYDKQQRKLEQDRQFAYEEALKENPELTYEEFMSVQPMTLNLVEEPQPSQALKDFMEKYL